MGLRGLTPENVSRTRPHLMPLLAYDQQPPSCPVRHVTVRMNPRNARLLLVPAAACCTAALVEAAIYPTSTVPRAFTRPKYEIARVRTCEPITVGSVCQ